MTNLPETSLRADDHADWSMGMGDPNKNTSCIKCVDCEGGSAARYLRASNNTSDPREYPTNVTGRLPKTRLDNKSPSTAPVLMAKALQFIHGLSVGNVRYGHSVCVYGGYRPIICPIFNSAIGAIDFIKALSTVRLMISALTYFMALDLIRVDNADESSSRACTSFSKSSS